MRQNPVRLTPAERQCRRQHQIDLGKATIGYRNYALLEKNGFINNPLVPPDPPKNMSKRQFDKEIREWRRKLHASTMSNFLIVMITPIIITKWKMIMYKCFCG